MTTQITPTSELQAVNIMLSSIGEAPVNTLGSGLQEAEIAEVVLDNINREVQSLGWIFNTDLRKTLSPNTNGHIDLPSNCMKVDTVSVLRDYTTDIVERDRRLYDRVTNSFIFTKDIDVDMVVLLSFDGLPEVARRYITLKAGRKFQENNSNASGENKIQRKEFRTLKNSLKSESRSSLD